MAAKRVTYRYLVYGVLEAIHQVFADKKVTREQAWFWVKVSINSLKRKNLNILHARTGSYLRLFTDIPVGLQYTSANNMLPNRRYIDLPENIFDLERENGIDWLSWYNKVSDEKCDCPTYFQRSTFREIEHIKQNPHESPNKDRPYFVRVNHRLLLWGIENVPVSALGINMSAYTTENLALNKASLDDEVLLNDEEVSAVLKKSIDMAAWMLTVPEERSQTGADETMLQKAAQVSDNVTESEIING